MHFQACLKKANFKDSSVRFCCLQNLCTDNSKQLSNLFRCGRKLHQVYFFPPLCCFLHKELSENIRLTKSQKVKSLCNPTLSYHMPWLYYNIAEKIFFYLFNIQAVLSLADRLKYFYPIREDFHLCRKLFFKTTIWCFPGSSVLNFQRQIPRSWKILLYYFFQERVSLVLITISFSQWEAM